MKLCWLKCILQEQWYQTLLFSELQTARYECLVQPLAPCAENMDFLQWDQERAATAVRCLQIGRVGQEGGRLRKDVVTASWAVKGSCKKELTGSQFPVRLILQCFMPHERRFVLYFRWMLHKVRLATGLNRLCAVSGKSSKVLKTSGAGEGYTTGGGWWLHWICRKGRG